MQGAAGWGTGGERRQARVTLAPTNPPQRVPESFRRRYPRLMGRTVSRITPASCETVGAMLDNEVPAYAWCSRCNASSNVRLEELAELKGRDYSLVRKRAHCPVCNELVAFHALPNRGGWRVNLSELED